MVEGFEHQRGGDGVVGDQRHPGGVGHRGDSFEVDDIAGRVADRLEEDGAGPLVDQ